MSNPNAFESAYDAFDEEAFMQALNAAQGTLIHDVEPVVTWEPAMANSAIRVTGGEATIPSSEVEDWADLGRMEAATLDPKSTAANPDMQLSYAYAERFADAVLAANKTFANDGERLGEDYEVGRERLAALGDLVMSRSDIGVRTPTTDQAGKLALAGVSR